MFCESNQFFFLSMDQDEEMDITPLAQTQPLFMVDERNSEEKRDKDDRDHDSDSGHDEDPNCTVEDEEDDEVSVAKKASVGDGEKVQTNGKQHSESEESSDEEDEEDERDDGDQTTAEAVKRLPATSSLQCQTLSS